MSRSRRVLRAAVIVLLVGLLCWHFLKRSSPELTPPQQAPLSPAPAPAPRQTTPLEDNHPTAPPSAPEAPKESTLLEAPQPAPRANLTPPKLEQVRKEVAANPHETPPSILAFAERLAPQMSLAFNSPDAATKLFPLLANCVQAQDTVSSIQALCADNAQRLAQKYPGPLKARYERMLEEAPNQVRSLLDTAEALQSGPIQR